MGKINSLNFDFGDHKYTLLPCRVAKLAEFTEWVEELISIWIEERFSLDDTLINPQSLELMQNILNCLPRHGQPGKFGFDFELLDGDYERIESLFFGSNVLNSIAYLNDSRGQTVVTLDSDKIEPSELTLLHKASHKKKLEKAQILVMKRAELNQEKK